eukprot:GFUD01032278.1.p1 GENE.GFUD01032278.1~~GFUD01032278.1.p1  ORF type:complete len:408 (+),score=104.57 GFUD01032278.1:35-1258(+)
MSLDTMAQGRGRGGRGAPFGNSEHRKELRRPIGAPTADSLIGQVQNMDLKNSFNINANEFVPTKFGPRLSVSASEFVPGQYDPVKEGGKGGPDEPGQHPSVTILYEAMYQLTLEPGRFDSIARKLTKDLNGVIQDYETLEALAEIILENGINEPNFRYTGARLCDYLSLHLTVIIEGATLRQIIMQKCNREFKQREGLLKDNAERLRGFILFLAELFQQLEIQVGAVVQRVAVLGDALPQLISTLGNQPEKENVRCIVQTLKCCGQVLEEEERNKPSNTGNTPTMDKTMEQLDTLSDTAGMEASLVDMLKSLVKLRRSNWGHSPPSSVVTNTGSDQTPGLGTYQLDPTFYAPDGEALTMEEYSFLEEYGVNDEDGFSEPMAWSTGEEPGGMGDEAEAAYEEFLRLQS